MNIKHLRWLWWLRNIAIAGQIAAVLVATRLLDIPLNEPPLWGIITSLALVNGMTAWQLRHKTEISEYGLGVQLLLDIGALTGLLYFTGGASNPFATFFILQVIVAATILPARTTSFIAGVTILIYSALLFWKVEIPLLSHHHDGEVFSLHIKGMWVAFVLLAMLVAWFIVRMNATIHRQQALLHEAEEITALGTLAATAAHELCTPLATLSLIAEQYGKEPSEAARKKNQRILQEQLARCKEALSRMAATSGVARAESGSATSLPLFLGNMVEEWKMHYPDARLDSEIQQEPALRILGDYGLQRAITHLLDNAAHASPESLSFRAHWDAKNLAVIIQDRGKGIPETIKAQLGRPGIASTKENGLGMGIFLAKTIVNRFGGTLHLQSAIGNGTAATMTIPLRSLMI